MADVQSPEQFLADFTDLAKHATKRIHIQSMMFEQGDVISKLEPLLISKAKEGLDVHITVDAIAQRYTNDNPNIIIPFGGQRKKTFDRIHGENDKVRKRLILGGVKFTTTKRFNPVWFVFPILKRNHRKIYIIDDIVWVGGVNFYDKGFRMIDFMVKFTDPTIVTIFAEEFYRVNTKRSKSNLSVACDKDTSVLLDAGVFGKSVIYDEAVSLVKQAQESITFVSQFIPDGDLLDALLNASKRNVQIRIITGPKNNKDFTKFPYNIPYENFKKKINGVQNIHISHQTSALHAKLLLVDGKAAIFGSHNLVNVGVLLATEEIGIKTTDKDLVKQLGEYIKQHTTTT